jgi:hypothetical protein
MPYSILGCDSRNARQRDFFERATLRLERFKRLFNRRADFRVQTFAEILFRHANAQTGDGLR